MKDYINPTKIKVVRPAGLKARFKDTYIQYPKKVRKVIKDIHQEYPESNEKTNTNKGTSVGVIIALLGIIAVTLIAGFIYTVHRNNSIDKAELDRAIRVQRTISNYKRGL